MLSNKRAVLLGISIGFLACACAGFSYKYFGLEGVSYVDGKLLGPKPEFDRPFSDCAPNAQSKHPCVVMFAPEFFNLKKDLLETRQRLNDCERARNQNP